MYRQTTATDGTTTITCTGCGQTRGFRSDLMLRRYKRDHPKHCPAHRPHDTGGAA